MLRSVSFRYADSKYPGFRRFDTIFDFKVKNVKNNSESFLEPLFFEIKPYCDFEGEYYSTNMYIVVFEVSFSSNSNSNFYLAYELYENAVFFNITNILELKLNNEIYNNEILVVRAVNRLKFGGGEFKIFSSEEKLREYYRWYFYPDDDNDEEESCFSYYNEEEIEEELEY